VIVPLSAQADSLTAPLPITDVSVILPCCGLKFSPMPYFFRLLPLGFSKCGKHELLTSARDGCFPIRHHALGFLQEGFSDFSEKWQQKKNEPSVSLVIVLLEFSPINGKSILYLQGQMGTLVE
jgi:hypothetical protein